MLRPGHCNASWEAGIEMNMEGSSNLTFLITQDSGPPMLKLLCTWTGFIEYAASSELVQCSVGIVNSEDKPHKQNKTKKRN